MYHSFSQNRIQWTVVLLKIAWFIIYAMLRWEGDCITECWELRVDCVECGNWSTFMVHISRLLIPDWPSTVRLWREKCVLEEWCLAAAVLLLQISPLQHQEILFSICVIVCYLFVFRIKNGCTYVLLTLYSLMVWLDVLVLVQFANCVGNDQLMAEIHHQPCRSHFENGRYN